MLNILETVQERDILQCETNRNLRPYSKMSFRMILCDLEQGWKISWYFRKYKKYHIFLYFPENEIYSKLYNNGCNTLMQYLMTIIYHSFVPYVKT